LARLIDRTHAAPADEVKNFELREKLSNFVHTWSHEAYLSTLAGAWGGAKAGFEQALRADPLGSIGGQRLAAACTDSHRVAHIFLPVS
jgi:hypothetical protein